MTILPDYVTIIIGTLTAFHEKPVPQFRARADFGLLLPLTRDIIVRVGADQLT